MKDRKGELNVFTGHLLGIASIVVFVLVGSAIVGSMAIISVIIPVAMVVGVVMALIVGIFWKVAMRPTRRLFLAQCLLPLLGSEEPEGAVTFFSADSFLAEYGGLHCAVEQQDGGTWLLTFSVFRTTKWWGSEITERMPPSPSLQKKLRKVGIITERDGWHLFGRSEVPVDARDLLDKMSLAY